MRVLVLAILLPLTVVKLGCAALIPVGSTFDYERVAELKLGGPMLPEDFGEPVERHEEQGPADRSYSRRLYLRGNAAGTFRRLVTEYVDGQLNAFLYTSRYSEDETRIAKGPPPQVGERIDDVYSRLGSPDGRIRCPTLLAPMAEVCERFSFVDVVAWVSAEDFTNYELLLLAADSDARVLWVGVERVGY
ncbi:MAG: hypothetical protein AAFQ82_25765 [Myxococcota bacterium]